MSVKILMCMLLGIVLLVGCRGGQQESNGGEFGYRSQPSSPEEAALLMQDLDEQAYESGWESGVLRHMREQMRGRLHVAGLSDAEIDKWVQSDK